MAKNASKTRKTAVSACLNTLRLSQKPLKNTPKNIRNAFWLLKTSQTSYISIPPSMKQIGPGSETQGPETCFCTCTWYRAASSEKHQQSLEKHLKNTKNTFWLLVPSQTNYISISRSMKQIGPGSETHGPETCFGIPGLLAQILNVYRSTGVPTRSLKC